MLRTAACVKRRVLSVRLVMMVNFVVYHVKWVAIKLCHFHLGQVFNSSEREGTFICFRHQFHFH